MSAVGTHGERDDVLRLERPLAIREAKRRSPAQHEGQLLLRRLPLIRPASLPGLDFDHRTT